MILEQLKKDIDEQVRLYINNDININEVEIKFIDDIMCVTLPGAVHKIKIKGRIIMVRDLKFKDLKPKDFL